jgi:hypothetical protein
MRVPAAFALATFLLPQIITSYPPSSAGGLDINGLTAEPLINPFDDPLPFYDSSATANRKLLFGDLGTDVGRTFWRVETDYIGATPVWTGISVTGTGAGCGTVAAEVGRLGLRQCTTGTTATGRATLTTADFINSTVYQVLLSSGRVRYTSWVRFPTLSDGTNTYIGCFGFGNSTGCGHTDAVEFRYTDSVNSGKWRGVCTEDSASTNVDDTGAAVAAATWYRLDFEVNSGATSVEFFVNGTSIGTCASNIPDSNDPLTYINGIIKSVGLTARTVTVDGIRQYGEFSSTR